MTIDDTGKRRIIVVRGSPDRATADVSHTIADELRAQGLLADVVTPAQVGGLGGVHGVVVGSALVLGGWHPAAIRFLRRHATVLRIRPSWLFQVDRHPQRTPAGALTGLTHDTAIPNCLSTVLDDPVAVTFHPRTSGRTSSRSLDEQALERQWARGIAAEIVPTPVR